MSSLCSLLLRVSATTALLLAPGFSSAREAPPPTASEQPPAETEATSPGSDATKPVALKTHRTTAAGVTMEVKSFTLENGLRVFVQEDHSTPTFSLQIVYDVGSRDEAEGRTGFAHFFEHMMFKGSKNVPDGGHLEHVLGAGGKTNATTRPDFTQYFSVLPSHYLDMALWLEADRLRSLEVNDEKFENQRNAVKEEKAMRYDNAPYAKVMLEFFAEAWAGTGYGHMGIGTDEDLDGATVGDVQEFFDKYYVPNNAVMAVVGDVDAKQVQSKVIEHFAGIPRGAEREPFAPISHEQVKIERNIGDKLAQQPLFIVGWKTVPQSHPDRHAVTLLMNVLLRGESSRITRILKDEKKLVAASLPLPPGIGGGRDAGTAFAAFAPTPGSTFDQVKAVIREEVKTVRRRGITNKELRKAINQLTVDTFTNLSTNNGRALLIATGAMFDDDPTHVLSDLDRFQKVTARDVKRVANTYLTDKWLELQISPAK